ncbi:NAD(P)-binding Rossmann-fold superfamily protein [Tripterygium wilfordii]|uniref:NAD(P)-binding Rossmann-fold superfamily protein n=1 Tax=Tripterygium wilfordii TaxID=458696 RepID=A0A7J7CPY2_TRIWF|nr:short-chain dehydrogenase/reductase ARMGADRAFT_1018421 [Tripterygium wilfordii]KAF5736121.1 NAD(P)-binding Rossmann-fold superfamily protein [Tripterygium wilfordii]
MRSMSAVSSYQRGIAAIVGVGPNLGRSIARKFAHEGYTVAILARDLGRLSRFADEIAREEKAQVFAIRIDCADSKSVREAFEGVLSLGFVEVLVYNAYQPVSYPSNFTDIRIDSFEKSLAVSSVGAFHCAQQVIPGMVERGRGTILFTGCSVSLNGIAGFSELCCGKFALRGLSQCLAKEFQPSGVHVAHVIIDGIVGPPRGPSAAVGSSSQRSLVGEQQRGGVGEGSVMMDPDSLAQTYWHLHVQDRTAWTQEIDLRPSSHTRFF